VYYSYLYPVSPSSVERCVLFLRGARKRNRFELTDVTCKAITTMTTMMMARVTMETTQLLQPSMSDLLATELNREATAKQRA